MSILPGPVVLPAAGFLLAKGLDYVAGFAIGTTIVFWGHVLFALFVLAWIVSCPACFSRVRLSILSR